MFQPKPTQKPWPPINIGGDGPAALRRAATVGDGWIPMNHSVDEIGPAIERLQQLRSDAGRPGRSTVTFGATPDFDEARRLADLGIDRVLVRPWGETEEPADGLQQYAEEVVHRLAE